MGVRVSAKSFCAISMRVEALFVMAAMGGIRNRVLGRETSGGGKGGVRIKGSAAQVSLFETGELRGVEAFVFECLLHSARGYTLCRACTCR